MQSLVLKNRVQLDSMVEDGMFTIVMVLEYVVSEPVSAEDRKVYTLYFLFPTGFYI